MIAQLHDRDGVVEVTDLTQLGRQDAAFQCYRLLEEINEAADNEPNPEEHELPCHGLDFAALVN